MRMRMMAVLAAGTVWACTGSDTEQNVEDTAPAAESAAAGEAASQIDDADIAAIVVTANTIDVTYGELARERAEDARVREFAETMIRDHTAVNQSAQELVTRLGVTPTANDVSTSLDEAAAGTRARLGALSGAEFDRAYIANEVDYHRLVLNALDETLIPNAANAELRETLVSVRPAFQAHLDHAESLLRQLSGN